MSQTKVGQHIPEGPWVWRDFGGGYSLYTAHSGAKVVLMPMVRTPTPVLGVRDEHGVLEEITPDHPVARHLAAVPDLLAALEELVERIERWEEDVRSVIHVDPKHGMDLTEARSAIAKARNTR